MCWIELGSVPVKMRNSRKNGSENEQIYVGQEQDNKQKQDVEKQANSETDVHQITTDNSMKEKGWIKK